jgi:hypothetical protein
MTLSELRILYEVFDQDRRKVERAIASIDEEFVTIDEVEREDYFIYGKFIYSSDNYVSDYYGNLVERDNAFWCSGYEEYFNIEDSVTVYEYRNEDRYSRRYAEQNCDWNEYRGEYYDQEALAEHDLVYVEDAGEIMNEDSAYYHEEEGNWYTYPSDRQEYTRGYHDGSYQSVNFDGKSKYKIGYEIEKEDQRVLESINIEDFEQETGGVWRKERDGSLNEGTGYELISPTFEFNIDKIFEHIEGNSTLVKHINAEISTRCGGHIHLSEAGLSGEQLFDKVKGYTPLFYALYYGRVDKTYCKGKANIDLKCENEKYQAIKIHHDRIEFRIISAVPNVKTLKWRTKLLMMILQHPTNDIIKAYYNVDTKFTKILKQTYSDEKLVELKERFIKFTRQFEGIDINNNKK